jgi:flagellar hook assembly protein FlgD
MSTLAFRRPRRGGAMLRSILLGAGVILAATLFPAESALADVLSNVGVIPNPFSPNADGVFDSTAVHYTLSDTAAIVVSVADSSLVEIATVWSGWEYAGEHRHYWDGTVSGAPAPDGEYVFIVEAIPFQGGVEEATFRFRLDTTPPTIASLDVVPSRFSPDGDGVGDSLRVETLIHLSAPADETSVTVRETNNEIVRILLEDAGVSSALLHWNGRTTAGTLAADGLYYVQARSWDDAGNTSSAGALVDLDIAPPALGVDWTIPGVHEVRTADTTAVVSGWAYDRGGVVDVEVSTDGLSWIGATFAGPDTVLWHHALTCASCVPGAEDETVQVRARARDGTATADGQGHTNTATTTPPVLAFNVVFDVAGPLHESTTAQGGNTTVTPGATLVITTKWDAAGYDIDADLSLIDSAFDPSHVTVTDAGTGTYTVRYTVSTGNTLVPVDNAPVGITATDAFERVATDTSLRITVLPVPEAPAGLGLSLNAFNPGNSETVTVGFGSSNGEGRVEIFNMAGTRVRVLESQGASIEWDGTNDAGDVVASGVYFVRIERGSVDTVRKVAVVK